MHLNICATVVTDVQTLSDREALFKYSVRQVHSRRRLVLLRQTPGGGRGATSISEFLFSYISWTPSSQPPFNLDNSDEASENSRWIRWRSRCVSQARVRLLLDFFLYLKDMTFTYCPCPSFVQFPWKHPAQQAEVCQVFTYKALWEPPCLVFHIFHRFS